MASEAGSSRGKVLRATLCEIERGVFYASYPDAGPGIAIDVIYQVGASATDAKRKIEQTARQHGYEIVIWKDDLAEPLFAGNDQTSGIARLPPSNHRIRWVDGYRDYPV